MDGRCMGGVLAFFLDGLVHLNRDSNSDLLVAEEADDSRPI